MRFIILLLLAIPRLLVADPDSAITHWVGLIPKDFQLNNFAVEDRQNLHWNISLHEKPSAESDKTASIHVSFLPEDNLGLNAILIIAGSSKEIVIRPHLYESDWTYSAYFHLTVLDTVNGWVKVKPSKDEEASWGNFGEAFGRKNVFFLGIRAGSLLTWANDIGESESVFVEHVNPESLIVREEQPVDMWCGDESLRYEPYDTFVLPIEKWIDEEHGESRFEIKYSRGC